MGSEAITEIELAALRDDAKRYRFIRQFGDPNFDGDFIANEEPVSPEHMDALVDAAMIKSKFEE